MARRRWMKDAMARAESLDGFKAYTPIGQKVKNRSGKIGTVEGTAGGYLLVRFIEGSKLLGYLPDELEVIEGEPTA